MVGVPSVSSALSRAKIGSDVNCERRKNTMGSKMYSPGTNHFDPDSPLFKPEQSEFQSLVPVLDLHCATRERYHHLRHWSSRDGPPPLLRRA